LGRCFKRKKSRDKRGVREETKLTQSQIVSKGIIGETAYYLKDRKRKS